MRLPPSAADCASRPPSVGPPIIARTGAARLEDAPGESRGQATDDGGGAEEPERRRGAGQADDQDPHEQDPDHQQRQADRYRDTDLLDRAEAVREALVPAAAPRRAPSLGGP